jgi:hypothetical protein
LFLASDRDIGLAVIERWTHLFLTSYYDKAGPETSLEDLMVKPFEDKGALAANIGTKEDTSRRKFKDIRLSEFFGEKGGSAEFKTAPVTIRSAVDPEKIEVSEVYGERSSESTRQRLPRELKYTDTAFDNIPLRSPQDDRSGLFGRECPNDDLRSREEDNTTLAFSLAGLISAVIVLSFLERSIVGWMLSTEKVRDAT